MGQTIQRWLPGILVSGLILGAIWLGSQLRPKPGNYIVVVNSDGITEERLTLLIPTETGEIKEIAIEAPNCLGVEKGAIRVISFAAAFGDGTAKLVDIDGNVIKKWQFAPPGRYNSSAVLFVDKKVNHTVFNSLQVRMTAAR